MSHIDANRQRQFAVDVVTHLGAQGYQALWAGGCVRDRLLERTPGDYDVATDATPDQIRQAFGRRKTLAIGAAFGVITVVGPKEAGQVEVTTFRQDASYSDGRRPDSVTFSSAKEDAQRRDFTINGLFFDPLADRVIDYVDGLTDLHAGIVRAIGDPRARFREDKLRMLRAVRFAALLDFQLDGATQSAIGQMAAEITVVSPERIAAEMEKMLISAGRARAVRLLQETGLLAAVVPESEPAVAAGHPWQRTLDLLDAIAEPTFALTLAVLLHGAGGPELAEQIGERWRLAKRDSTRAAWLLERWGSLESARRLPWSRLQPLLTGDGAAELLELHAALAKVGACEGEEIAYCRDRLALPPADLNPPPLITGRDLIAKGIPPDRAYTRLLQQVREAQLDGQAVDRNSALELVDRLLLSLPETQGG